MLLAEAQEVWDRLSFTAKAHASQWIDATQMFLADAEDPADEERRLAYARHLLVRWYSDIRLGHE